jgi:hypothetical protein
MPFAEPLPNSGLVSREFETGDAGRPDSVQDGLTAGALRLERHPLDAEWECGSVMASATPAIRQQRVVPSRLFPRSLGNLEPTALRPGLQVVRATAHAPHRSPCSADALTHCPNGFDAASGPSTTPRSSKY